MDNKKLRIDAENLLLGYLNEKEYELGDDEKRNLQNCVFQMADAGKSFDSSALGIGSDEEYLIFRWVDREKDEEELKSELKELFQGKEYEQCYIVLLTDSIEKKVALQSRKKEIRQTAVKRGKCTLGKVSCEIMFLCSCTQERFRIHIGSRARSLFTQIWEPGNEFEGVKEYEFSGRLSDVVKIYNRLGDRLFEQNVRYGIGEQLDVEKEIKKTLKSQLDQFYFLNNGITMLLQLKGNFHVVSPKELVVSYGEDSDISVINGAQTISSVANFWYLDSSEEEKNAVEENARVLLRLICINSENPNKKAVIDKISISLNRQKPIREEDIRYTTSTVTELNRLCEENGDDDVHFHILKRGELAYGKHQYRLVEFARVVTAYQLQLPGAARSKGGDILLRSKEVLREINEDEADEMFENYYRPVNFSLSLLNQYQNFLKYYKSDINHPEIDAIVKNGRYYFLAYVVWTLNHGVTDDFKNFDPDMGKISCELKDYIEKYAELLEKVALEQGGLNQINSNVFKKEELYNKMVCYPDQGEDDILKQEIIGYQEELRNYFRK